MAGTFRLTMQQGPNTGKSFEIAKDVLTLGRDVSNDIVINDAEVSRHHSRFTRQGDGYAVEDLGSTNGTFVNGMRLTGSRALAHSDVVALGETILLGYEMIAAEVASTAEAAAPPPAQVMSRPVSTTAPDLPEPSREPQMAEPVQDESGGRSTRRIAIGCGCLTIVGCLALMAGGYYIDSQNLYCAIAPSIIPGC